MIGLAQLLFYTDGKDNNKAHYGSHEGYLPSPEQIQEARQRMCTHVLAFRQKSVDKIPIRQKDCRPKIVD